MDGAHEVETPPPGTLGGSSGEWGGEAKAQFDLGLRLQRYGRAKAHTLHLLDDLGNARADGLGIRWSRVRECGDFLEFRDYFRAQRLKLARANFCMNHRLCTLCAIRRGGRYVSAYLPKWAHLRALHPGWRLHLVTVTVRNGEDLGERLGLLHRSWRTMLHRRHLGRGSVMASVVGGVYATEVTNGGKGWHPHVHALCIVDGVAPDKWRLSEEWRRVTGDSFVVDVREVAAVERYQERDGVRGQLDVDQHVGGFAEVFKYIAKPSELGADRFAEFYATTGSRRMIGSFGCLRGVRVPPSLTDDLGGLELEPYVRFFARFVEGRYLRDYGDGEVRCDSAPRPWASPSRLLAGSRRPCSAVGGLVAAGGGSPTDGGGF